MAVIPETLINAFELVHGPVIAQVFNKLSRDVMTRDLSFEQMTAIMLILMEGPKTISNIAAAVDVSHYSASRMVDRMVKSGLFSRTEDPVDRRQKQIDLTDKGRAVPLAFRESTRHAFAEVLGGIPVADLDRLVTAMDVAAKHLPPLREPLRRNAQRA